MSHHIASTHLFHPCAAGDASPLLNGSSATQGERQWWKRIVVCGDDFGMNDSIDSGVMRLAALGRLSAVSCLSQGPTFAKHGKGLQAFDLDLGVHLNLTQDLGDPAQAPVISLPALITRAYAGRLDAAWVDQHLTRQFDAFENVMGRAPDYVDGHQHVHQLPGVLPRLLRLLAQRYGSNASWLRHTAPGMLDGVPLREAVKARLVGAMGASAVARIAGRDGWRMNRRLLGVYDPQGGARHYSRLLQLWLHNARDGDLVVCLPAVSGGCDIQAAQRVAEFEVLARPELADWMRLNGVCVARPIRSAARELTAV